MILFTSGYPQSGKTELSRKIAAKIDSVIHVDPKAFYLTEFEEMSDKMRSAIAISAWEMAMERTHEHIIDEPNNTLIIFDTCCSNEGAMRSLFTNAKYHDHDIFFVFVQSPQKDRQRRSPNTDLSQYESKYREDFIGTLPILAKLSDQFVRVTNNNEGGFAELDKCAEKIAQDVEKIRSG